MDNLTKYSSDDEASQSQGVEAGNSKLANLESEWENFEKMLAGGTNEDESAKPTTDNSVDDTQNQEAPVSNVAAGMSNPYAYLSQFDQRETNTDGQTASDMERQLEEFLEQAAKAASEAAQTSNENADNMSQSDSDRNSGSESGNESDGSGHSPSHSGEELDKVSDNKAPSSTEASTSKNDNDDKVASQQDSKSRRSGSPLRHSRSRRSHSRSRSHRSRSRSHGRKHRRRRSSSRSRHGGSRRRRRSGSRHRRSHRSRSPHRRSHDSSKHRSSRHRRSRRRSASRDRRRGSSRRAQFAHGPASKGPVQEDFKTRMKRELQQAAKEALAGKGQATPQQALLQTMAAMHAKAQELTGVEIPKFYNPAAINPLKFAEQQQKRKLLWSKAGENKEQSLQKFQGTNVVADEKYRKLMGIKGEISVTEQSEEQKQKQNELFAKLDQEYALARLTTHTHRGMGLGVVSSLAAASANEQFNKP